MFLWVLPHTYRLTGLQEQVHERTMQAFIVEKNSCTIK